MSQTVWPLNENGEIVFTAGTGSGNVTGYLNQDVLPSTDGGIPVVFAKTKTGSISAESLGIRPSPWGDSSESERQTNDNAMASLLLFLKNNSYSTKIIFPDRKYNFSATFDLRDMNRRLDLQGGGYAQTEFIFHTPVSDSPTNRIPFLLLPELGCTYNSFSNIHFRPATVGTGQFCRVSERSAQTGGDGVANWKNYWANCQVSNFAIGLELTSPDPTDGDVGEQASETTLFNLKFRNNRRTFWIRNRMAYNTTLFAVDVENDQEPEGEAWDFIRDDNGGGIKVYGGSWIGKGAHLRIGRRYAGAKNFSGSTIKFDGVRFECRPGYGEASIVQDVDSLKDETQWIFVSITGCHYDLFGQSIKAVKFTNRVSVKYKDCHADSGKMLISHNPTASSANYAVGAIGSVHAVDCHGFEIAQDAGNTYGTFSRQQTVPIVVKNLPASNGAFSVDSDGFMTLGAGGICQQQLGHMLGTAEEFSLVVNDSAETDGSAISNEIKFKLPPFAMPISFGMFKHPVRFSKVFTYELWLVKDKADWAGASFSRASDAARVSLITSQVGTAGFVEELVALQSNITGFRLQSGFTSWKEGRMLIRKYTGPDEILTNPDFSSSTGWNVAAGWSISGGKLIAASAAANTSTATSAPVLIAGKTYTIGITCDSISAGSFKLLMEGGASVFGDKTTAGTFSAQVTAAQTGRLYIWANSTLSAQFDNVTVKEVLSTPISDSDNFGGFFRIKYL